ncbi:phosphorothioated DNA-binding restriction endonuclease [Photorhabdus laumondii]|uniref:Photorhabdus luminescens subsp. laumondii TTO1 complete genome segment 15/17 n=1 Tax=Photorhabdus laumondii subsp. laumondii (strain DSM 15139 / CIP 105565 / TT01) TaxID=243265 RepID=Q7MZG4_PHOLL|nr:HNH endonuclease [Photorhabdus laumondii]AXG49188.1 HNH endonuclease [Photorhabdus laumondii subsp. laumondii]KTL62910.1 restriction endonuclease [Photorhabdus laumondii subsp. laumondii]CAE16697.1 unnamed protein product [Photorhabdus laumondii subsp. laumondii TTO1]
MTSLAALQTAISKLTVWRKGDQRAPHKPLLLLYVLSEYKKGHGQLFKYGDEIHQPLLQLLTDFGPSRKEHYPSMPFWRLRRDGFWELKNAEHCTPRRGSKEPPKRELIEYQVAGGFDSDSFQLLRRQPALVDELAQQILNEHFPESVQVSLVERLGFDINKRLNSRDPRFRDVVLRAYHYRCAVCGYDLRLDGSLVGLEAAHIKWKQFGGPCLVENGLALCTLHHSAFDRGAIGIDENLKIKISDGVNRSPVVEQLFWARDGESLYLPRNRQYYPADRFIEWHQTQVFKT